MEKDEIKLGRAENLTGRQFGFLEALYRTNNIGKHTAWKCKCLRDGNLVSVRIDHLKEKRVISCGCYNAEKASLHLKNINKKGKNMKDITNMKSGFLVAIEPTDKRISYGEKDSRVIWKCKCCNPEHTVPIYCEVTVTDITSKNKISCGCIHSKGETKIINLLTEHNIFYEREKRFINFNKYRFDFFVNNEYIIEYDGIQHFTEDKNVGWSESLKEIQERDTIKNLWCKENNIPLIRIPYTHLKNLCIKDLILETSNFII